MNTITAGIIIMNMSLRWKYALLALLNTRGVKDCSNGVLHSADPLLHTVSQQSMNVLGEVMKRAGKVVRIDMIQIIAIPARALNVDRTEEENLSMSR